MQKEKNTCCYLLVRLCSRLFKTLFKKNVFYTTTTSYPVRTILQQSITALVEQNVYKYYIVSSLFLISSIVEARLASFFIFVDILLYACITVV